MASIGEIRKTWDRCFLGAARERGLRTVGGYVFRDDDPHLVESALLVDRKDEGLKAAWWVATKPLALDDVLWAAFLPDLDAGPVKRRNLRVNGAFAAPSLQLVSDDRLVPVDADPAPVVTHVLDTFGAQRAEHLRLTPTPADFLTRCRSVTQGRTLRPRDLLREALALIVAERHDEAVTLLEDAVSRDERPPMSSEEGTVWEVLARHYSGQ